MKNKTLLVATIGIAAVVSCTTNDPDAVCGDEIRDTNEQCDDGNTVSGDGCSATCLVEIPEGCGDGVVSGDEACDDGAESATCNLNCTVSVCGDAIRNVAAAEACDDGNTDNGDGCSSNCRLELPGDVCGDGVVTGDETCDDTGESATCDDDCTAVECGDGNVNEAADEACDDGNTTDDDACSNSCQPTAQSCGLGTLGCGMMLSGMTDDAGATTDYDAYDCLTGADKSGPERVYEWVADRTGTINVYNETTGVVDVIVLEAQSDCSLGTCVAGGSAGVLFDATIGTRYLIIIDTDAAAPPGTNYYVGMTCP